MDSNENTTKHIPIVEDAKENDLAVLRSMLGYIGVQFREIDDLLNQAVSRERLLDSQTVEYYNTVFKPQWRELNYNTGKLTSLRRNNVESQKFPAVNMLRQILKCHKLHLKPHIQSMGYDPNTGKKRYRHEYIIHRVFMYTIPPGEEDIVYE
jgi:hypothetical protein